MSSKVTKVLNTDVKNNQGPERRRKRKLKAGARLKRIILSCLISDRYAEDGCTVALKKQNHLDVIAKPGLSSNRVTMRLSSFNSPEVQTVL